MHLPGELPGGLAGASDTKPPADPWAATVFSCGWRKSSVGSCAPNGPAERKSRANNEYGVPGNRRYRSNRARDRVRGHGRIRDDRYRYK